MVPTLTQLYNDSMAKGVDPEQVRSHSGSIATRNVSPRRLEHVQRLLAPSIIVRWLETA